jgi:hypothetical protein
MRLLRIAVSGCVAAVMATVGSPASALDCVGIGDWTSESVFVATVATQGEVDDRGGEYLMTVDEVWRAEVPASLWVTYESIWDDPFPLVGSSYVMALEDGLVVSNCSVVAASRRDAVAARPRHVRPPTELSWWELVRWHVTLALG